MLQSVVADLYTIDDIYDLPDGEREEQIDGQIYMMAPLNHKHQKGLQKPIKYFYKLADISKEAPGGSG